MEGATKMHDITLNNAADVLNKGPETPRNLGLAFLSGAWNVVKGTASRLVGLPLGALWGTLSAPIASAGKVYRDAYNIGQSAAKGPVGKFLGGALAALSTIAAIPTGILNIPYGFAKGALVGLAHGTTAAANMHKIIYEKGFDTGEILDKLDLKELQKQTKKLEDKRDMLSPKKENQEQTPNEDLTRRTQAVNTTARENQVTIGNTQNRPNGFRPLADNSQRVNNPTTPVATGTNTNQHTPPKVPPRVPPRHPQ